jgi:hypothetical protein
MRTKADIRRLLLVMGSRWLHAEGGPPGNRQAPGRGSVPGVFSGPGGRNYRPPKK